MTTATTSPLQLGLLFAYKAAGVQHVTLYAFPWEMKTIERLGPVVEAVRRLEREHAAVTA